MAHFMWPQEFRFLLVVVKSWENNQIGKSTANGNMESVASAETGMTKK